jgi:hypothetical protein
MKFIFIIFRSVLRVPDVYPGSEFFHPGSQIDGHNDSRSVSKNLSIFSPKNLFPSSRKQDLGCSSRIWILMFYPSRIPIQGSKWLRIPDPDPQHWFRFGILFIFSRIFHGYAFVNFMYNYLFYITLD